MKYKEQCRYYYGERHQSRSYISSTRNISTNSLESKHNRSYSLRTLYDKQPKYSIRPLLRVGRNGSSFRTKDFTSSHNGYVYNFRWADILRRFNRRYTNGGGLYYFRWYRFIGNGKETGSGSRSGSCHSLLRYT